MLVNTFQKLFFEVGWRCSANEGRNMRLDTFASKRFFIFLQGDRKANAKKPHKHLEISILWNLKLSAEKQALQRV
ncbi:MAG: hypothetical protein CMI65_00110 [Pedosphaera sp.]|nr:hypothetical protein [Pedosphaera sp.]